ncbi:uncharacterized protein [Elaeis guineensis]|uniref:uncharacterized protein isoform X2 n=2 Tax=Elaeis guineensis var. tenera TaxID=51953 RepID=UPI003C6D1C7B
MRLSTNGATPWLMLMELATLDNPCFFDLDNCWNLLLIHYGYSYECLNYEEGNNMECSRGKRKMYNMPEYKEVLVIEVFSWFNLLQELKMERCFFDDGGIDTCAQFLPILPQSIETRACDMAAIYS